MAIDYDTLLNWPFPDVEQTYTEKDSILYALGVGLGNDPLDAGQLRYVFEEPKLIALPTMAAVLGTQVSGCAKRPPVSLGKRFYMVNKASNSIGPYQRQRPLLPKRG